MARHDERLRSYLVGDLSEEEQTDLESQYFADVTLVDRLIQVETGLLDEYARGRLSLDMRDRVAHRYRAHPMRRERLKFAEMLALELDRLAAAAPDSILEERTDRSPWRRGALAWWHDPGRAAGFSMAVASLLLMVTAGWLFTERIRLREELNRTRAARGTQEERARALQEQLAHERASAQALIAELDRLRTAQSPPARVPGPARSIPTVVSLVLSIGVARGPDADPTRTLRIPSGTEQVRFQLNLKESEYLRYQVVLQPAGGSGILHREDLQPTRARSGWLLILTVPASRFASGDYMLTLTGVTQSGDSEDVSKSIFRVEK